VVQEVFGYLPNLSGGLFQDLDWGRNDLVFAAGNGRRVTGVSPGVLMQWGTPYGLGNFSERGDPDQDGDSTSVEYLRDGDPTGPGKPGKSRTHFVELDRTRYFAWTVALPARIEYAANPEGVIRGTTGLAADVFAPAVDPLGNRPPGLRLVEVVPAVAAGPGLPPVSPFHRYRTFRLSEPASSSAQGYIVNRVVPSDD
jgi:hypothetical protein